jgi:hypothetical protein
MENTARRQDGHERIDVAGVFLRVGSKSAQVSSKSYSDGALRSLRFCGTTRRSGRGCNHPRVSHKQMSTSGNGRKSDKQQITIITSSLSRLGTRIFWLQARKGSLGVVAKIVDA